MDKRILQSMADIVKRQPDAHVKKHMADMVADAMAENSVQREHFSAARWFEQCGLAAEPNLT